jgi:hypothetical protein
MTKNKKTSKHKFYGEITQKDRDFKKKHGFYPVEWWNVDSFTTKFILPRLKYFNKHKHSYAVGTTFDQWTEIVNKMIRAFEISQDWDRAKSEYFGKTKKEKQQIDREYKEGMRLFAKYYRDLWD